MHKKKSQPRNYIIKPEKVKSLPYHDIERMESEIGPLYKFVDPQKVAGADVTILVRKVEREISARKKIGASVHKHSFDQLYCILGDLSVEIFMNGKRKTIQGPASVFLPAGLDHASDFVGGKGYAVNILFTKKYE